MGKQSLLLVKENQLIIGRQHWGPEVGHKEYWYLQLHELSPPIFSKSDKTQEKHSYCCFW